MGLDLWDPGDVAMDVKEESNLCTSIWIEVGVGSASKYKVKGVVTNRSKKWDQSIGLPLSCATENVIQDLLSFLHTVRGKKQTHSMLVLILGCSNFFTQYRCLERPWHIFAVLAKSATTLKNQGACDICITSLVWITNQHLECRRLCITEAGDVGINTVGMFRWSLVRYGLKNPCTLQLLYLTVHLAICAVAAFQI